MQFRLAPTCFSVCLVNDKTTVEYLRVTVTFEYFNFENSTYILKGFFSQTTETHSTTFITTIPIKCNSVTLLSINHIVNEEN